MSATRGNPADEPEQPTQAASPRSSRSPWLVFGCLLVLFLCFPSRHYDGDALKRLLVMFKGFQAEGPNHPFTSAYYLAWWSLWKGIAPSDIVGRIDVMVAMNSLLGAATAAIGAAWLARIGLSRTHVLLGGFMLGLTSAAVYHSTQTTEPMAAQFWFMLSLFIGAQSGLGIWSGILSGICWATAVATYQSYFLAGPFLMWLHARRWRDAIPWAAAAGLAGFFWFGLAAHLNGLPGLSGFIKYVTTKPDGEYWGFFKLEQAARVPFGFAGALAVPWPVKNWPGFILGFSRLPVFWKILCAAGILIAWILAIGALVTPPTDDRRRFRWPLLLGFLACTFAPFYLSPQYWKLWLLPVAIIQLLGIIVASGRRWGTWALAACLLLQAASNIPRLLIQPHDPDAPSINAELALKQTIRTTDLLICDVWGDAGLYCAVNPKQNLLNLMLHHDGIDALWATVRSNLASGRKVYVYGVVDRTREEWDRTDLGTRPRLLKFEEAMSLKPHLSKPIWLGPEKRCHENLYEVTSAPAP